MQQKPQGAIEGLVQLISRERRLAAVIVAVLILAILGNAFLGFGVQYNVKEKRAKLDAKMQDDAQKFQEDLVRQQILSDAKKKAEIKNTLSQFINTFMYDANLINNTVNEYNPPLNISDKNLANKAAAAKKFALAVNEYASHVDGMGDYVQQNAAEFRRLGADENTTSTMVNGFESTVSYFKTLENYAIIDLETFANTSSARRAIAADAIETLRESEGLQ